MRQLTVAVPGGAAYPVWLGGPEVLGRLAGLLAPAHRVAVVHQPTVAGLAARVAAAAGRPADLVAVPDGEAAKRVAAAARLWDAFGRLGLQRGDAVVSVGGGAVSDLAGFAAATWLRGVAVVHVPTTLLAMVDAAIGGKTGLNTRVGKNLVGAFHHPRGVLCDVAALAGLPSGQLAGGLAEVVKAGFVADSCILAILESRLPASPDGGSRPPAELAERLGAGDPGGPLAELVERAVAVKAAVVGADPAEAGPREVLNYGHTLGHAVERLERYRIGHGAAVSVGLCYAAQLGRLAGRLDAAGCARHAALLGRLGLPTGYPAAAWPRLRRAMAADKKARGGRLRFVVLAAVGRPELLESPAEDLLAAAYREVSV